MNLFNKKSDEVDPLQVAIDDIYSELKGFTGDTEGYNSLTDQLVKLKKLQKEMSPSWRPSPDALVGAAGSVLGIVLILHYEKIGVISSKALGFVGRMVK